MAAAVAQAVVQSAFIKKMCAAIQSESVGELEEHLKEHGILHGKCRQGGHTLLTKAVEQQSFEMTELLISRGAQLEGRDDSGSTPLIIAACKGNIELVKYLLDSGADVHAKNNYGCNPLDIAINHGRNALASNQSEAHQRYLRVGDILEKAGGRATPGNHRCGGCE